MGKRKCTFNEKLKAEYKFLKTVEKQEDRAHCSVCNAEFSVGHKGKGDINEHVKSEKHKRALITSVSLPPLNLYFTDSQLANDPLRATEDAGFSYHNANFDLSFKTTDCAPSKRRRCRFNDKLKSEYTFLEKSETQDDRVHCLICDGEFSVAHKGRGDIREHLRCEKHKRALANGISFPKSSSYLKSSHLTDAQKWAAKEAAFIYHNAKHDLSLRATDCLSNLIKELLEPKCFADHSKTEDILTEVTSPYVFEEMLEGIQSINYVTTTINCSSHNNMKFVEIMIRYFTAQDGVQVKLMCVEDVPEETSDNLLDCLLDNLNKYSLAGKLICYCSCVDNNITSFFGLNKKGEGNVFRKLEQNLSHPVLAIGCSNRIINNCLQTAADTLPVDIEMTVIKICRFFHTNNVRTGELKEFCDFLDEEYMTIASYTDQTFLNLLPIIQRILEIFEDLKCYFLSSEISPLILKTFFENPVNAFYLLFLHDTLPTFQNIIKKLEPKNIIATESVFIYSALEFNLKGRLQSQFIPIPAKELLSKLIATNVTNADKIMDNVMKFYQTCLEYLSNWKISLEQTSRFHWILLESEISLKNCKESSEVVNEIIKDSINVIEVSVERMLINQIVHLKKQEWGLNNVSIEEKWIHIFEYCQSIRAPVGNIFKLVEFAMCLPGTATSVQQFFSIIDKVWSSAGDSMDVQTVKALLNVKVNSKHSCIEFYNNIKSNKAVLDAVLSCERDSETECEPQASTSTGLP